jgi:hypothetical protein
LNTNKGGKLKIILLMGKGKKRRENKMIHKKDYTLSAGTISKGSG